MGKYMKKNKMGGAVVDISMGVRTRARTLALSKQQQQVNVLNFCYLELRSRKLEKVQPPPKSVPRPPQHGAPKRQRVAPQAIAVVSISSSQKQQSVSQQQQQPQRDGDDASRVLVAVRTSEAEASCGDNAFDHDANSSRDSFCISEHFRRVREGTPVCFVDAPAEAPGSSSRPRPVSGNVEPVLLPYSRKPSQEEIESFFAELEDVPEPEGLCERYNYDFVNDVPLPGRFEWTSPEAASTMELVVAAA